MGLKDTVKPWYETGDYPTQGQFWTWMDGLRWNDEPLTIEQITGLTEILNGLATPVERFTTTDETFEYTVPIGYQLETITLKPFANCSPWAEIEDADTEDLFATLIPQDDTTIMKPSGKSWSVEEPALINTRRVKIYNLPAGTIVFLIKRKLT